MVAAMDISGPFLARALSPGAWLLTRSQPPALEIFVQGAQLDAAQIQSLANSSDLQIEWQESGAVLGLRSAAQSTQLRARSVIVHESRPWLYQGLPLADFDAATQRFWRRIFRLVRIPGGRYLLRMLARRGRTNG
jgi:hypothetical protein